jgi:phage terminase small subunit
MARAASNHPALSGLTEKRRRFVLAYVGEALGNATEAARIAGYSKPTEEGSFLLRNPQVQEALQAIAAPAQNAKIATTEQLHERLSAIALGLVEDAKPSDSVNAAKLMLQARGELVKKHEHTHVPGTREEILARLEQVAAKLKGGA